MASYTTSGKPPREMKVLALGLPRTGSMSIARALTILGYQDVYHLVNTIDNMNDYIVFNRAADATFPSLPSYDPDASFTRKDWDELWAPCEATCEVASFFAPQLIEAYPEAKVLLVVRDFDNWERSIEESVFQGVWGWPADISIRYLEPILGSLGGTATRKMLLGFFDAKDVNEARRNTRMAWERHHRRIREMVPPERLLEYRMGDGWEPLCDFLGKPIPDGIDFPRVNDAKAMKALIWKKVLSNAVDVSKRLGPWVIAITGIGFGVRSLWTQ